MNARWTRRLLLAATVALLATGCRPATTSTSGAPAPVAPATAVPSPSKTPSLPKAGLRRVSRELAQVSSSVASVTRDVNAAQTAENTPDSPTS